MYYPDVETTARHLLEGVFKSENEALKEREDKLLKAEKALSEEKDRWEETKARYVLEQLRLINGGAR